MTDERQFPAGTRVDDLDLSGVHLHGASFEGARLTDAYFCGADISGDFEGARINGIDIEPLIQAELDRRFPDRVRLRSTDLDGLRGAWSMVESLWGEATERASRLPQDLQFRRVDGEWSFVETLRHLIFATDCWLFRGVQLVSCPYHPWGLPWTGVEPAWARHIGIDTLSTPSLAEVLPVREEHQQAVRDTLERLTDAELADVRVPPDDEGHPSGEHSVLQCLHVLLNEEWQHHRYAVRDLNQLDPEEARR
jgi:hypothetical protein